VDGGVTIEDRIAANDTAISAGQILLPNSQEFITEFFKEIYKESLNSYRFYGSLRASIVWPPVTLVSASAIYLLSNDDIHLIPYGQYMIPLVFSVVLGLTAYINFRRRKGGTYPLSHLYGYFGLVRLSRLGHDVAWVMPLGPVWGHEEPLKIRRRTATTRAHRARAGSWRMS
jgi:hypothetical protein